MCEKPKQEGMKIKANNGKGNNESRDGWRTPRVLFNQLDRQYNFNFDCCAIFENTKCEDYSDEFEDIGLRKLQEKICWMNPPFSRAERMFKHFFEVVCQGVAIYRCDNFETKIWQEVIFPNATWILIPNTRVVYEGMIGSGSRFPSALIGYNVSVPRLNTKRLCGTILKVKSY
jgi:hypothetical protein